MFYIFAFDLILILLVGLFTSHTFGGIIYILPAFAIIIGSLNINNNRHILQSAAADKILRHSYDRVL